MFQICLSLALVSVVVEARRVRVRPVASDDLDQTPQQIEYYAEQEDANSPVLVSRQDAYGRATGQPRLQPRAKPENKQPPVQTLRNYNKLNDDGSFTFGYEAADGSFKEETRGTDCVVRGKYGYVDPDGNKREFTYVSGNPCDPNAVNQEDEELPADSGEDNVPQNFPRVPIKPLRPQKPSRPAQTLFQQTYSSQSAEDEEEESVPIIPSRHVPAKPLYRPSYIQQDDVIQPQILRPTQRPTARPSAKAAFISQPTPKAAIRITPRPATVEPATTYRPQVLQATPSPTPAYTKQYRPSYQSTVAPINFDDEFKKFQLENNVVSSTTSSPSPTKSTTSDPIYSSELVFDPASGQYNTVLFQQLPQAVGGGVNLKGKLQPYVENPFAARPYFAPQRPLPYQQQLFQQQQAALFQQSQQLFQQQQQRKQQKVPQPSPSSPAYQSPRGLLQPQRFPASLLQQEPQQFTPIAQSPRYVAPKLQASSQRYQFPQAQSPIQPFYYVSPQGDQRHNLAAGQIDAFLRGHSISI